MCGSCVPINPPSQVQKPSTTAARTTLTCTPGSPRSAGMPIAITLDIVFCLGLTLAWTVLLPAARLIGSNVAENELIILSGLVWR